MRILLFSSNPRNELLYRSAPERMLHTITVIDDISLIAETIIIYEFDIIILDLPGFFLDNEKGELIGKCSQLADKASTLVLSESGTETDRLTALEQGAHDCLIGPPSVRNIEIVINSLIRRLERSNDRKSDCGPLRMDRSVFTVELDGERIKLTPKEFILLELLIKRQGRIVTTDFIMSHIFNAKEYGGANLVHPHICRLRAKIKHPDVRIESEYGIGYKIFISA